MKKHKKKLSDNRKKESRWPHRPTCLGTYHAFWAKFFVEKRLCLKGLKIEDASEKYGITSSSPPNLTLTYHTKFGQTQSGATVPLTF
jgi:hypothetical protein